MTLDTVSNSDLVTAVIMNSLRLTVCFGNAMSTITRPLSSSRLTTWNVTMHSHALISTFIGVRVSSQISGKLICIGVKLVH